MNWAVFLPYLAVTAGVTYLIRMLPLTVFRREIKSRLSGPSSPIFRTLCSGL